MTKYCTFNNGIFKDLKDPNELALFIYLYSGKFVGIEKDKLPITIGMSKTAFAKAWKHLTDLGYIHETDKGLTVSDEPDPLFNDTNAIPTLFEQPPHALVKWLHEQCPRVQRMKQPITTKEARHLMTEFHKEPLKDVFKAMENRGNLHKAYVSANLTVRSWIDDAHKKESKPKYIATA